MSTIVTRAGKGSPLTHTEVDNNFTNLNTDKYQSGDSASFSSITNTGNLTFTGTGNRITGDFSNATVANRVAFQNSTTNADTFPSVLPNGTSTSAGINIFNNSDPTNAGIAQYRVTSGEVSLRSAITGTGTYLPLTMFTGGSERLRIDTSGNVGIGTSSPTRALTVYTTAATDNNLLLRSGAANAYLCFADVGTTDQTGLSVRIGSSGNNLVFNTGGTTERMRIDSSGNVGIGTASPNFGGNTIALGVNGSSSSALNLLVNGTGAFTVSSGSGYTALADGRGSTVMLFSLGGSERMRIDSSGRLLVNSTAAANGKFLVNNGTNLNTQIRSGIRLAGSSIQSIQDNLATDSPLEIYVGSAQLQLEGTPVTFLTSGTERMRIDSSGNVGIGTSSPQGRLHVNGGYFGVQHNAGNTYPAYNTYFGALGSNFSNGGSELDIWNTVNSGFVFRKQTGASAQTELMRINGDGNVGIGTSTLNGAKLFVAQGAAQSPATSGNMTTGMITGSGATGEALNIGTDADGVWYNAAYANNAGVARLHRWLTGGTERMRLTSGGQLRTTVTGTTLMDDYGCRAWVNFNGTGTVSIRASGNVSSITDNGTGDYTVNFTTSMPDANFSIVGSSGDAGSVATNGGTGIRPKTYATGSIRFVNTVAAGVAADFEFQNIAVFR